MEMIVENLQYFNTYQGSGHYLILLICSIVFLVFGRTSENKHKYNRIVLYICFVSVIYWMPFSSQILKRYLTGNNVYCRMFWVFHISLVVAYVAVELLCIDEKKRIIALILVLSLFVLSGKYMFTEENFQEASNIAKLRGPVPQICEYIEQDAEIQECEIIRVIVEGEFVSSIRQYDGNIHMNYGRWSLDNPFVECLNAEYFDIYRLLELAYQSNSNYLVLYEVRDMQNTLVENRCRLVAEMDGYCIYYVNLNINSESIQ